MSPAKAARSSPRSKRLQIPVREGRVAVVGLGYVGLPTACMFAVNGVKVLGVDVKRDIVDSLLEGDSKPAESEIRSLFNLALHSGNLEMATRVAASDVYIIAVPTPVGEDHLADLSFVKDAVDSVASTVAPGALVVVESTIPPGTMRDVVVPAFVRHGLEPGVDVLVAHCPERVLPGATIVELVNNDRVIGGFDKASAARAAELYGIFVKGRLHLTDMTTAEMVKVMENTYRDVNIALANDFAMVAEGIGVDVWDAIALANNHPRVSILKPGPGVGGHCVAVDPWFLVQLSEPATRLIRTAREVNDGMPAYVVDRLMREAHIADGHVAVLGLAYRAGLGDVRQSPALEIIRQLEAHGISARAHDPLVSSADLTVKNFSLVDALTGASAIVLATDHQEFRDLDPQLIVNLVASRTIFDTRGCLAREAWARAGFRVVPLGKATE